MEASVVSRSTGGFKKVAGAGSKGTPCEVSRGSWTALQGLRDAYTDGGKTVNIIGPPYSNPKYTNTYAQVKASTL